MRRYGLMILFIFVFVYLIFSYAEAINYTMSWVFQFFNSPNAQ